MAGGRETGRASLGIGVGNNYSIAQAFATLGELWGSVLGRVTFSEVRDAEVEFSENRAAEVSSAEVRTAEVAFSEVPT